MVLNRSLRGHVPSQIIQEVGYNLRTECGNLIMLLEALPSNGRMELLESIRRRIPHAGHGGQHSGQDVVGYYEGLEEHYDQDIHGNFTGNGNGTRIEKFMKALRRDEAEVEARAMLSRGKVDGSRRQALLAWLPWEEAHEELCGACRVPDEDTRGLGYRFVMRCACRSGVLEPALRLLVDKWATEKGKVRRWNVICLPFEETIQYPLIRTNSLQR